MFAVEYLRFRVQFFQKIFMLVAGKLIKPEEVNKIHGSIPFFMGLMICMAFFMKEVAILSFLFLMVGDPCAAWFGERYGKHKIYNKKSWEGFIAGVCGAFIAGCLFLFIHMHLMPDSLFSQFTGQHSGLVLLGVFAGAVAGFILELFSSSGFLDDNLMIPAGSGFVMSCFLWLVFGFQWNLIFYPLRDLLFPIG